MSDEAIGKLVSSEAGQGRTCPQAFCDLWQISELGGYWAEVVVPAGWPLEAALCPLPCGPPPFLEARRQGSFSSRSVGGQSLSGRRASRHCLAWACVRDHTSTLVAVLNTVTSSHHLPLCSSVKARPGSCSWGGRGLEEVTVRTWGSKGWPHSACQWFLRVLGTAQCACEILTIVSGDCTTKHPDVFHKEEEIGVLLRLCLWTPTFKRTLNHLPARRNSSHRVWT